MQIKKIAICAALSFLFVFSSCKKQTDETWYFYDETKCADVWQQYFITTTLEGLVEYHFSEFTEVIVDEIDIDENGGEEQFCEACNCTTGTRIRVRADLQYQAAMEAEGFELE